MKKFLTLLFLLAALPVSADTIISGVISSDTTWSPNGGVYVIDSSFSVASGATLTIEPGAIIKAKITASGGPSIYGNLIAEGTSELPIYFTSISDDSIGGDTAGDATTTGAVGQWQGLYFKSGSTGELNHIIIRYSGYGGSGFGDYVGVENDGGMVNIKNSLIDQNNQHGIWQKGGVLILENSVVSHQLYGITIWAGTTTAVSDTFSSNSQYGLNVTGGDSLTLTNNNFIGNAKTAYIAAPISFSHNGNTSSDITNRGFEIAGEIGDGAVWHSSDLPLIIPAGGIVWVLANRTLTLDPGSIVKFGLSGQMIVEGTLISQGTKSSKIYLTSLKDDSVAGDTNGDGAISVPAMTNWDGVIFRNGSMGEISHTAIRYSGGFNGTGRAAIFNLGGNVLLDNITFSNNFQNDIYQNTGSSTISHSLFSTSTNPALSNTGTSSIDARINWWGTNTGPSHSTNATGTGSTISDNVLFSPWLRRDPALPNPVIVVPGIMGSYLNKEDGTEVWMNLLKMVFPGDDSYLDELQLSTNGESINNPILKPTDIVRKVNVPLFSRDLFEGILQEFTDKGYVEGQDLFVFPYDWRLDLQTSALSLKDKIDQIESQTGTEKVDIIAHSMGGLLVKQYLKDNGSNSIEKFIDLGTPHRGAPKSFLTLMYGETDIAILNKETLKSISQNMPAVYQLLPSQNYFDDSDASYKYYIFDGVNNSQRLTFDDTKSYLKSESRNSLLIDRADAFHQEIDNLNPADYEVETYNIVGCGTPTIGQFYILDKERDKYNYNIKMINGDGTVPLKSAEAIPALKTYYVKSAQHALMPSTSGVKELVAGILTGEENINISPYSNLALNADNCQIPNGKIVSFHSPIELHIYDQSGNHTGSDANGDIENNIAGVTYEVIDDNKFAFLPNGTNYTIKGKATDTGTFDVRIEEMVNGEVTTTAIFNEIPLTINTQVNFDLGPDIPSQIYLDNDGDNVFESSQSISTTTVGFLESTGKIEKVVAHIATSSTFGNSKAQFLHTQQELEKATTSSEILALIPAPAHKLIGETIVQSKPLEISAEPEVASTIQNTKYENTATVYKSFAQSLISVFKKWWFWIKSKL